MSEKFFGHKTVSTGEIGPTGFPVLKHIPLTKDEAEAIIAAAEAQDKARAELMPDEKAALRMLTDAYHRLKQLGWKEVDYAHGAKKEGKVSLLIELGSSGIHEGYYHGVNDKDVWWIGAEGWPSHPVLVKDVPTDTRDQK